MLKNASSKLEFAIANNFWQLNVPLESDLSIILHHGSEFLDGLPC